MTAARFFRVYEIAAGVAASGNADVGIAEGDKDTYGPFDVVYVFNTSNQNIYLEPDGITNKKMIFPKNSFLVMDVLTFKSLWLFNMDTVNATDGIVYVTVVGL